MTESVVSIGSFLALVPRIVVSSGLIEIAIDDSPPTGAVLVLDDEVELSGIKVTDASGSYDATTDSNYQAQTVLATCLPGHSATILHQDTGETAAHRVRVAGSAADLIVTSDKLVRLLYSPSEQRWVAYDMRGEQGLQGETGATGATGATGVTGPQGPAGPDTFSPATSSHWAGTPPSTMTDAIDRLAAYANQGSLLALLGVSKP